jgi:hypothetical protein
MLFKTKISYAFFLGCTILHLTSHKLLAQTNIDSVACLTRFKIGETGSYKIPMTNFCFVKGAGLSKDYSNGWVMKRDVVKKINSNLLFMEMNSTDVEGWSGNEDVSGSVQLVFELPSFSDSIVLKKLTNKSKGLYIINNYGGITAKKEYVNGELKITKGKDNTFIYSTLHLITEAPNTKQEFILDKNCVQSISFTQYQEFENARDSIRETENDLMANTLTQSIILRDSLSDIEDTRIKDSLKLHPYTGNFRFWVSDINKAGFSRVTYSITNDSLTIKEGPYDFIYLDKNYSGDSVYFKKALNQKERALLANVGQRIEVDTLENSYTNFCIIDGLILSFIFESAKFSKDVTVSNYYNESIGFAVEFINKVSPEKYQLWYDKKVLLKQQSECDRWRTKDKQK